VRKTGRCRALGGEKIDRRKACACDGRHIGLDGGFQFGAGPTAGSQPIDDGRRPAERVPHQREASGRERKAAARLTPGAQTAEQPSGGRGELRLAGQSGVSAGGTLIDLRLETRKPQQSNLKQQRRSSCG